MSYNDRLFGQLQVCDTEITGNQSFFWQSQSAQWRACKLPFVFVIHISFICLFSFLRISVWLPWFSDFLIPFQVTLCLIPDVICLAGLIHIAWIRLCKRPIGQSNRAECGKINLVLPTPFDCNTPTDDFPWNVSSTSGGRTLFVTKCRSCVIRMEFGKGTLRNFDEHMRKPILRDQLKKRWTEFQSTAIPSEDTHATSVQFVTNPRADLRMVITLACSLLIFTVPQDIEWLSLYKMSYSGDNNFVKNFQLIKIAELVRQISDCWYLLGWALFMPLICLTNPIVRAQFTKLYCQRIRCRSHQCRLCYCGFYCDTEEHTDYVKGETLSVSWYTYANTKKFTREHVVHKDLCHKKH